MIATGEITGETIVNADNESAINERGKNRCNNALTILNWLEKINQSKDRDKRDLRSDALLKEVTEQAFDWQVGRSVGENKELNTGGTEGETLTLLVGLGVLKEMPTFEKSPQSSQINFVDVNEDEIVLSFNIEHPDNFDIKRATYKFSRNPSLLQIAVSEIEKQKNEFIRKEYGWKKIGSAIKLIKEIQNKK